jgi:hypothetical protein
MQKLIIIASVVLCLGTLTGCEKDNSSQATGTELNASSKHECESQNGTWVQSNGKCTVSLKSLE